MSQRRNYLNSGMLYDEKQRYCKHDCDIDSCSLCNEHGALVEKVICSKNVQSHVELLLPVALEPGALVGFLIGLLGDIVNVTIEPNYAGIQQRITVLKDKVVVSGYIPATIALEGGAIVLPGGDIVGIPIRIFFQEHVECPGACPDDQVIASQPIVEAEAIQPLIIGGTPTTSLLNLNLFNAIVRTHVTVIRTGIKRHGKICDLDNRRCRPNFGPVQINTPLNTMGNTAFNGTTTTGLTPPSV